MVLFILASISAGFKAKLGRAGVSEMDCFLLESFNNVILLVFFLTIAEDFRPGVSGNSGRSTGGEVSIGDAVNGKGFVSIGGLPEQVFNRDMIPENTPNIMMMIY